MMLPLYTVWYDNPNNNSIVLVRKNTTHDVQCFIWDLQRKGITSIEVWLTASMIDITKEFIK